MARILVVEDDRGISNLIRKNLELVGHECQAAFDGDEAARALEKSVFDLIILDVMLPKHDGFQVMEDSEADTPVIFLTARGEVKDRVRGLNMGGYDYIVKPFDMLELQARIDSVLRRTTGYLQQFTLGEVVVDLQSRQIYHARELVDIAPKEFLLIEALVKNRNIALSRERLLALAWGYDFPGDTRTVDVHIHNIRKKLGWEQVIKTVYKLGYRLEVHS